MTERKAIAAYALPDGIRLPQERLENFESRVQALLDDGFMLEKTEHMSESGITLLIFKRGELLPVVDGDNGFVPTSRIWKSEDERREWFARYTKNAPNG